MRTISLIIITILLFGCNNKNQDKNYCSDGNCKNGYGRYNHSNEGYEIGYWENGKLNGYGVQYMGLGRFCGDYYTGQFKNGVYHGYGEYTWINSDVSVKGNFVNGVLKGKGEVSFGKQSPWQRDTFIGNWENGVCEEFEQLIKYTPSGKRFFDHPTVFMDTVNKCFNNVSVPFRQLKDYIAKLNQNEYETTELNDNQLNDLIVLVNLVKEKAKINLARLKEIEEYDKDIRYLESVQNVVELIDYEINKSFSNFFIVLKDKPSDDKRYMLTKCIFPFIARYYVVDNRFRTSEKEFIERYKVEFD